MSLPLTASFARETAASYRSRAIRDPREKTREALYFALKKNF